MKCQLELSESRGVKFSLKLFPPNKNGYFGKHNWRVHAFEYFKICEEKFNFKEAISIFFSFFLKSGYQHMLLPFFYSPKYSSVVKKDSNPNQLQVVENLGLRLYCMQSVAFDSLSLLIIQVFFIIIRGKFFLSNHISIDSQHLMQPPKAVALFGMPSDVHLLISLFCPAILHLVIFHSPVSCFLHTLY